jgi:dsRNA-specific ribonuclease
MNGEDIHVEKNSVGNDIYVFNPYNPANRLITLEDVQAILKKYGVDAPITNFNLYKRAFVHRSYTRRPDTENAVNNIVILHPQPSNCLPLYTKSNERLEFIGDGILECITKYYLYRRFPKENEGFMTEKKIALVKNEAIGKLAFEMGLHKWFIMSTHAEIKQTRTNLKKLGCLFESFIGAIFLDFNKISVKDEDKWFENTFVTGPGFQMVQIFIENVFEKHVNWIDLIRNDDNYKNILQVIIQKTFKTTPDYLELSMHTQDSGYHTGVFLSLCVQTHLIVPSESIPLTRFNSINQIHEYMSKNGKIVVFLGEGRHKVKKQAEQLSCQMAIQNIRNLS